jgi:hypothetical protein
MVKDIDKTRSTTRSVRPLTWTAFQWARWLIKFSQYGNLSPNERQALRGEAQWFPQTIYRTDGGEQVLADEQMRILALKVDEALRCCARRDRWRVPYKIEPDRTPLTLYAAPGLPLSHVSNGFENAFLTRVAELISTTGRSVRACARPQCPRLFAVLRNGAFCSRPCAQHVHTTTYRARKHERAFTKLIRNMGAAKAERLIERERARKAKKASRQETKKRERNAQLGREAGMVELDAKLDPAEAERWQRQGDMTAPLRKPT